MLNHHKIILLLQHYIFLFTSFGEKIWIWIQVQWIRIRNTGNRSRSFAGQLAYGMVWTGGGGTRSAVAAPKTGHTTVLCAPWWMREGLSPGFGMQAVINPGGSFLVPAAYLSTLNSHLSLSQFTIIDYFSNISAPIVQYICERQTEWMKQRTPHHLIDISDLTPDTWKGHWLDFCLYWHMGRSFTWLLLILTPGKDMDLTPSYPDNWEG